MLIKYDPQSAAKMEQINLVETVSKNDKPRSGLSKIKPVAGTTHGEFEIPGAAPLVFPRLDSLTEEQRQSQFKRWGAFIGDYYDRRSQATYAHKNPNSSLTVGPAPQFQSRYSDPNSAAASGSLIALVTGGHVDPWKHKQEKRQMKEQYRNRRREMKGRAPRYKHTIQQPGQPPPRKKGGPIGLVMKVIKKVC